MLFGFGFLKFLKCFFELLKIKDLFYVLFRSFFAGRSNHSAFDNKFLYAQILVAELFCEDINFK